MIRAERHPLVSGRSGPCHKSPESTVSLSVLVLFVIFWPTVETFIWLWLYGEWSPTELRRLWYHDNQDYKVFQDSHTCHEVLTDFVLEISLFTKHGGSEVFNSYHARNKIRFTYKKTLKQSAMTHHTYIIYHRIHNRAAFGRKEKRTSSTWYHDNPDYKAFQDSFICHKIFADFVLLLLKI